MGTFGKEHTVVKNVNQYSYYRKQDGELSKQNPTNKNAPNRTILGPAISLLCLSREELKLATLWDYLQ